jgi:hypothetical protein
VATEKLCGACFAERYPDRRPGVVVWARECTACRKPTQSRDTLIKVETAP